MGEWVGRRCELQGRLQAGMSEAKRRRGRMQLGRTKVGCLGGFEEVPDTMFDFSIMF